MSNMNTPRDFYEDLTPEALRTPDSPNEILDLIDGPGYYTQSVREVVITNEERKALRLESTTFMEPCPPEEAELWTIYERDANGISNALADFHTEADAMNVLHLVTRAHEKTREPDAPTAPAEQELGLRALALLKEYGGPHDSCEDDMNGGYDGFRALARNASELGLMGDED